MKTAEDNRSTVKRLAEQFRVEPERLIAMFDSAGISGKSEDDIVKPREKMVLLQHMQQGRVQTRKESDQSVPTRGRTGTQREITIGFKGGNRRRLALRETRRAMPAVAPEKEPEEVEAVPQETPTSLKTEQPQDIARESEHIEAIDVAEVAKEPEPLDAHPQPGEIEPAPEPEIQSVDVLSPDDTGQVEAQIPTEDSQQEPLAGSEVSDSPKPVPKDAKILAPAKSKAKRKSQKKVESDRKQLHVVKGKNRLRSERERERAAKNTKTKERLKQHGFTEPVSPIVYEVAIPELISVSDLAQAMSVKAAELIKRLMEYGQMATINDNLDKDTAFMLVEDMGHTPKEAEEIDLEADLLGTESDQRTEVLRSPVVAVMGHVDHGKTTLLDFVRTTKVAANEKGGITQHIGAYTVVTAKGSVTFLDTPGHEAFAAMRVRGAKATDIVILVVAADDGVKPQTVEAINHARNANVPIVVAINKMDKAKADPSRVLRELTEHNVIAEELGGDVQVSRVSALKGTGVDELLESVALQAEFLELTAPVEGPASGVVIEARVDRGRGPVATVLVQKGTLNKGDIVVAGVQKGRVRVLTNDHGKRVRAATPSMPLEIEGLSDVPVVGDEFICVANDRSARELVDFRRKKSKQSSARPNEIAFTGQDGPQTVNVVIKADVQGSAEAISSALKNLSNEDVKVKVIHEMVGGISQSDINLATAAGAVIFAFNVRAESNARRLIEDNGIQVYYSSVIYEATDVMTELISGMIEPEIVEEVVGLVDVREIYKMPKIGTIAGCYVQEGTVRRNLSVRVLRKGIIIHDGAIDSLRRFKNDVGEVKAGFECGIGVRNYHDIEVEDQFEIYQETNPT